MADDLQKEIDGFSKDLDRKLERGEITAREYDQIMANYECELNGSEPLYPWLD